MKKIVLIAAVLIVLAGANAFAIFGIGGAFAIDPIGGAIPGAALSIQLPSIPLLFGVGATFGPGYIRFGLTVDHWFWNFSITGPLKMYIGLGGYLNVNPFAVGARIPFGLQLWPLEMLELFIELAPALGVGFAPVDFPQWGLQGAVGFRFWF